MNVFLRNAQEILEVARAASGEDCDMALLVDAGGGITVASGTGWQFDALRAYYGAERSYRVRRDGHRVRVEGAAGGDTCSLETVAPRSGAALTGGFLVDRPQYSVRPALA